MRPGHDRNVGRPGSYDEAIAAISMYAACGVRVSVNTCLTRSNLDEIPTLRQQVQLLPVWMQTLAFLEWSGNVLTHPEEAPDYAEIAERAVDFVPLDDRKTWFDNVPFCIVRRKTREQRGVADVRLLSGADVLDLTARSDKLYPDACAEERCPLLSVCPGFEKRYVAARGWQDIPSRVDSFLGDIAHPARRAAVLGMPRGAMPVPRPAAGARGGSRPRQAKELVVVVKPTSLCNAACTYCSSHQVSAPPTLELPLLDRLYGSVRTLALSRGVSRLTFLWHGGEPLLLGREFYETAWQRTRSWPALSVTHLVQSNLLLLDRAWADLLHRYDVAVSTSVDPFGDERRQQDGTPQYPVWLERFVEACEAGVHLGIVFTVTPQHRGRAAEVYAFFRNLQGFARRPISVRVNPVYPAGRAGSHDAGTQLITAQDFGTFLGEIARLWRADGAPFPLSPVEEWVLGGPASCEFSGTCHEAFLAMDGAGNVFHCGRFADSGEPWGNLRVDDLETILAHPARAEFERRQAALREGPCADCEGWTHCRGGCPYHSFLVHGHVVAPTPFCTAYRTALAHPGITGVAQP